MNTGNKKYWMGVISREHILLGIKGGFVQLNHGKKTPLSLLSNGDGIIIYSPRTSYPDGNILRKFTAAGFVKNNGVYQVELSTDFKPWRIDVDFLKCRETPIKPLIEKLEFIKNKKNWGSAFSFGHLEIPAQDFETILKAMKAVSPENFAD